MSYVTQIVGVNLANEICIYGPRELSLDAYRQSISGEAIISGWFMQYLVPQVEIMMALDSPGEQTRYEERAWIRKVVDLSGKDLYLGDNSS